MRYILLAILLFHAPAPGQGCVTLTLPNLSQEFVEQLRVAAQSRQESLDAYMVEELSIRSGYHLRTGCKEQK